MSFIRASLLFSVLGTSVSTAILAQIRTSLPRTPTVNPEDRVLNIPYSAQRRFTYVKNLPDGRTDSTKTVGSKARDSKGRTYTADERQWTYLGVRKSEMLYRIYDPVAHTETRWDSASKEVKVIDETASKSDTQEGAVQAWLAIPYSSVEKLGERSFGGFKAEGTRRSYTVPVGQDHNDKPIVVVDESWYCPELKIVILETNDDPRYGRTRDELIDIVRGEPNVTKYLPPPDRIVHNIRVP